MGKPRDYITNYHSYGKQVTDATKIFFVGPEMTFIGHECAKSTKIKVGLSRTIGRLDMYQATHNTPPSCYCAGCDSLYVAINEPSDA